MNDLQHNRDYLGFGLGLRPVHYETIIETRPPVDWFEIVSEDFLVEGGPPLHYLEKIRENYPLVMHGVSLSIGSTDPLNQDYLEKIKTLVDRVQPCWISDHMCWTGVQGVNTHGLLPMPFTEEAVNHVVERTRQVQDFLGQQILLENISTYIDYSESEMMEWEFITAVSEKADCLILFDINNAYVNAFNHQFSSIDFIEGLPKDRVQQFHMAGHDYRGTHIIDTHDSPIVRNVWDLYEYSLKHFGKVSTLIERDGNIPDLSEMLEELERARLIYKNILSVEQLA